MNIVGGHIPAWIGWALIAFGLVAYGYHWLPEWGKRVTPGIAVIVSALLLCGSLIWFVLDTQIKFGASSEIPKTSSSEWPRLTDANKTQMSIILSNGNRYAVEIFRTPTPDSIKLASDFYDFLHNQMQWRIPRKPTTPLPGSEPEPGIRVATIPDNIPEGKIKDIKERSGALLLMQAIQHSGLPVMYETRGGTIDDLTIYLYIGIKPDH